MIDLTDLSEIVLPLDRFRDIMGMRPYNFWQMVTADPAHNLVGCEYVYTHKRWQKRKLGREDFIRALIRAEDAISELAHVWPGPKYTNRERVSIIKPRQIVRYSPRLHSLTVEKLRVINVGIQTWTPIEATVDVSLLYVPFQDYISFTVSVGATVTEEEVVVTYPGTQVAIRPITVSITLGTATIRIDKWLLGDPDLWDSSDNIDADSSSSFLQTLDVYRVWYNPSEQIILSWEPGWRCCGLPNSYCSEVALCQNSTSLACALPGDYKLGVIAYQSAEYANGTYTAISWPQPRFPDIAFVSYISGIDPRNNKYMSNYWSDIVAHLAVAMLDSDACGCEDVHELFRYWRTDMGHQKESGAYQLSPSMLENPFMGHMRGQVAAWAAIKRFFEV